MTPKERHHNYVQPPARDGAPGRRQVLRPGAAYYPGWLALAQQRRLVEAFRGWSVGSVPIRAASLPGAPQMSVRAVLALST
jgi:DNA oxidative demethylase